MKTLEIPDDLYHMMEDLCQKNGYADPDVWLRDLIESQTRQLRLDQAATIARRTQRGLQKQGLSEEQILDDFEAFRDQLRRDAESA